MYYKYAMCAWVYWYWFHGAVIARYIFCFSFRKKEVKINKFIGKLQNMTCIWFAIKSIKWIILTYFEMPTVQNGLMHRKIDSYEFDMLLMCFHYVTNWTLVLYFSIWLQYFREKLKTSRERRMNKNIALNAAGVIKSFKCI